MNCPTCGQEIKDTPTREIIYRANELIENQRCTWDEALQKAWCEFWDKDNDKI